MPRVSVIVPTYNRRDCLVCTIRSILAQTWRDLEVIVIDDGSSDESAVEVLRQLGPDPDRAESIWRQRVQSSNGSLGFGFWTSEIPLQYIYQSNRGIGASRNRGVQVSQGDLIAFLEPDYTWDAHHLEAHVNFLDSRPDAWLAHGTVVIGRPAAKGGKKRLRQIPPALGFQDVVEGRDLHTSAMVVRRACLLAHGCFDENLPACEDYDLWVRIAAHTPVQIVAEAVVHLRQAPPMTSWNLDRYKVYALEKAFQSGHLNADQRHRVAEEMVSRCDILFDGYKRRSNLERANFYDRKRKKFEIEVAKLDLSGVAQHPEEGRIAIGARAVEGSMSPTSPF